MLLAGPRETKLSLKKVMKIEQIATLPLILTTHPNSLRRMVELQFQAKGFRPNVRVQANSLPLMTDLVAHGLGYTVLPSCSVLGPVKAGKLNASPLEASASPG
jgi:LysR family nitrogen assimilation transcriptional regulator